MTPTSKVWALSALAAVCLQAQAQAYDQAYEFKTDEGLEGKISGVLTFGTQIRAHDPSPDGYSSVVSPFVDRKSVV